MRITMFAVMEMVIGKKFKFRGKIEKGKAKEGKSPEIDINAVKTYFFCVMKFIFFACPPPPFGRVPPNVSNSEYIPLWAILHRTSSRVSYNFYFFFVEISLLIINQYLKYCMSN